jgi:glycosyltransferase involved in cell wall biosynthesis
MNKVLILKDGQGWIVDRIVDEMVKRMPFDFTVKSYTTIPTDEFVELANNSDLTYYSNWDFSRHLWVLDKIKKPLLFSIRSHRYPEYIKGLAQNFDVHVVSPQLLDEFPNATYIPDAVFDDIAPDHEFTVGMAFQEQSREYKGYYLVKEACESLGCSLKVVTDKNPKEMPEFYKSVDVVVVASVAEGFSTIAMECMMMNKPVITTDVGVPSLLNIHKCERTVESIKEAIGRFYTYPQVKDYRWDLVCEQYTKLFNHLIFAPVSAT